MKTSLFIIILTNFLFVHFSLQETVGQDRLLLSTIEYPTLFQKEKTPGKGFGVARDLATEAFRTAGHQVHYHILPMARCTRMLKQYVANVGAINWFKNAKMMDQVIYTDVVNSTFVLFYKKSKFPNGIQFSTIEELKKYGRIGSVRGSSTTPVVKNAGLKIDWAPSLEINFIKLKRGRYDVAISIYLAGWATLEKLYPDQLDMFDCSQKDIYEIPISITFSKEKRDLFESFMKGLKTIANNGKYVEILNRYYGKNRIPDKILAILQQNMEFQAAEVQMTLKH